MEGEWGRMSAGQEKREERKEDKSRDDQVVRTQKVTRRSRAVVMVDVLLVQPCRSGCCRKTTAT